MFGGKIGLPEFILLALIGIFIAAPIVVAKSSRALLCYIAAALVFAVAASRELSNGLPSVLGAMLALAILPTVAAAAFWFITGRKNAGGQLRTAKVFFWFGYVLALVSPLAR